MHVERIEMLSHLPALPQDPLWALQAEFQKDTRPLKMDLIIGVYRDNDGNTPIFGAVKEAELQLAAEGRSKTYRALSGNPEFNEGAAKLLLGPNPLRLTRQYTMQAVGGTGALRLLAELIACTTPEATVWSSSPGYVNHRPIFEAAGLRMSSYRWLEGKVGIDLENVLADLRHARAGDIVVLHGCCHNPTGIDLTNDGWDAIARLCADRGIVPLVDMAYQGLGEGIEQDAVGLRLLTDRLDTVLVASSYSKIMGLYCERVGAVTVVGGSKNGIAPVGTALERLARTNYSMSPDHGASVAARLFSNPDTWLRELESMRRRIVEIRLALCEALQRLGAPADMQKLREHKGMFSLLPLAQDAMQQLRHEFAIYGTDSGRLNLAGLRTNQVPMLAAALAHVSRTWC